MHQLIKKNFEKQQTYKTDQSLDQNQGDSITEFLQMDLQTDKNQENNNKYINERFLQIQKNQDTKYKNSKTESDLQEENKDYQKKKSEDLNINFNNRKRNQTFTYQDYKNRNQQQINENESNENIKQSIDEMEVPNEFDGNKDNHKNPLVMESPFFQFFTEFEDFYGKNQVKKRNKGISDYFNKDNIKQLNQQQQNNSKYNASKNQKDNENDNDNIKNYFENKNKELKAQNQAGISGSSSQIFKLIRKESIGTKNNLFNSKNLINISNKIKSLEKFEQLDEIQNQDKNKNQNEKQKQKNNLAQNFDFLKKLDESLIIQYQDQNQKEDIKNQDQNFSQNLDKEYQNIMENLRKTLYEDIKKNGWKNIHNKKNLINHKKDIICCKKGTQQCCKLKLLEKIKQFQTQYQELSVYKKKAKKKIMGQNLEFIMVRVEILFEKTRVLEVFKHIFLDKRYTVISQLSIYKDVIYWYVDNQGHSLINDRDFVQLRYVKPNWPKKGQIAILYVSTEDFNHLLKSYKNQKCLLEKSKSEKFKKQSFKNKRGQFQSSYQLRQLEFESEKNKINQQNQKQIQNQPQSKFRIDHKDIENLNSINKGFKGIEKNLRTEKYIQQLDDQEIQQKKEKFSQCKNLDQDLEQVLKQAFDENCEELCYENQNYVDGQYDENNLKEENKDDNQERNQFQIQEQQQQQKNYQNGNESNNSSFNNFKNFLQSERVTRGISLGLQIMETEGDGVRLKFVSSFNLKGFLPSYFVSVVAGEGVMSWRRSSKTQCISIKKGDLYEQNIYENFVEIENREKHLDDIDFICESLQDHFIFADLSNSELENISKKMFYCKVEKDQYLMKEGDKGSCFFILEQGKVQIIVGGQIKKEIMPGTGLGELALLYKAERSASIKALEDCYFWGIERYEFKNTIDLMNQKKRDQNYQLINKTKLFDDLTKEQKISLSQAFYTQKFKKGEGILFQNDPANSFYIVQQGEVTCLKNGEQVRIFQKGESFGEQSLLEGKQKRILSIIAKSEEVYLIAIGKEDITEILGSKLQDVIYKNISKIILEQNDIFQQLNDVQMQKLLDNLQYQKWNEDQILNIKNKDSAKNFILCITGRILYQGKNKVCIEKFQYLGGNNCKLKLAQNQSSSASQIEEEDTEDLGSNQNFNNLNLISNIDKNKNLSSDQNESGLKMSENSSSDQDQNLTQNQIQNDFQNNTNTDDDKLQIQEESQIEVKIEKRENFGFDIIVEKNSVICQFNLDQVKEIFGDDIENLINASKNVTNNLIKYHHSKSKSIDQKQHLKLEDLEALQVLGEGQFGYVILVRERNNKDKYYALKIISKFLMQQMKTQKHVKTEKDIMEGIQHPFITQFYKAYQDKYNVYFLMEFVQGIELFDAIRDIGLLGTAEAQFFMSQILLQIEFLHQKDIIYRDLKPENIMIDKSGYLKLIDFGSPRKLSDNQRSYTILGTPHYMAPEVLSGKGYGKNADLWSMGICLFEFMSGMVPYGEEAEDPMTIYQEILKKQIVFPEFFVDSEAKKFVEVLLQKNPEFRMPGQNFASLKQVAWFEDFDWESLQLKQMKCQFQPSDNELLNLDKFKDKIGMGIQQFYQKNISILHIPEQNHELKKWEDEFGQKN